MRYLSKIIFINSANIRYAEINLDGNVHFIGTQGVGKSTILRAILFFYNADKQRLGIKTQQGQKSFDEFYLAHPDSYIIYEVSRENGSFFVMVFLSQGRAAFRFVDSPYNKSYFIDEDGAVGYEWGRISQRIGVKVFKSSIVRTQQQYLDIIYGNNTSLSRDLRKFAILESAKYSNVPKTIQNIFLNQSLESQAIKNIIIDSMDFADSCSIDLGRIRDEVKDFRMQYEDISKWYRKEKDGSVKVRNEADKVLETYSTFEACRRMISELTGQALSALERDKAALPTLERKISETELILSGKNRAAGEENAKYQKQRDDLKEQDGALKKVLDDTAARRNHYDAIGIDGIIEKMGHERELQVRRKSVGDQIDQLTSKNEDVKAKYSSLRENVQVVRRQRELEVRERASKMKDSESSETGALQEKMLQDTTSIRNGYEWKLQSGRELLSDIQREIAELQVSAERIKSANPYAEQMDEDKRRIDKFREDTVRLQIESAQRQTAIDSLTHETELKRMKLKSQADADIKDIEHQIEILDTQINKLEDLLQKQKGSFIEWLRKNVRGWERNIGKVADEEAVLYNTSLNPTVDKDGDSLFGVHIETENIDRSVRTPEDIQNEITLLKNKKNSLNDEILKRQASLKDEIEQLEKKPSSQLRQLKDEKRNIDVELQSIPPRIKSAESDLAQKTEALEKYRQERLDANYRELAETRERGQKAESELKLLENQRDKDLEKTGKNFKREKQEIASRYGALRKGLEEELRNIAAESDSHLKELDALMDRELQGLGVDTEHLTRLRSNLSAIESELNFINGRRRDFILWQRDKAELFDHEQENKDKRKTLRARLEDLDGKFAERKRKLDEAINLIEKELQQLKEQRKSLSQAIQDTEGFMASESWPSEFAADNNIQTARPLSEVLTELKDKVMTLGKNREGFIQAIKRFKTNFTPQNTFHFPTEFESDGDYTAFAANLSEFIANDKIETYRQRVSDRYAGILRTIGYETGNLMNNRSQVQATVNEINRDFLENNFVGVVKDIELRISDSSDRIVQHLGVIKRFNDEHADSIGEMNLFSSEGQRTQNNQQAVVLLTSLMDILDAEQKRTSVTLADVFKLEFRVKENDNDTLWVERLSNVGSDGTDILVKAMVNIMLINVFKKKVSKRFGDFRIHCMMDEIGRLHPDNVAGILDFANKRNIYLVNSSPTTYNASAYKYTYSLSKDPDNITIVKTLMTIL